MSKLNVNELMIGDWVYLPSIMSDDKYHIQVLETLCDCIKYYSGGKKMMVGYESIEPIPLTEEILEKNGFVLKDSSNNADTHKWWFLYNNDNKTIFMMNDEYKYSVSLRIIQASFVHELQHALRLCGIDKEIVL